MHEIWFWQRTISPHMAGLATALARQGCSVTYVAEKELTADRVKLGWQVPPLDGVRLCLTACKADRSSLILEARDKSLHLCQGIRGNGPISTTQRELAQHNLLQWVLMETVDDSGAVGVVKRWVYAQQIKNRQSSTGRILAIGHNTRDWVIKRGLAADLVSPFAYFLPDVELPGLLQRREPGPFRFLFVGQFISRKRLDLLIRTLYAIRDLEFELWVIGVGPQEKHLRDLAENALPGMVHWIGGRPQSEVIPIMSQADCLVLPSRHDGWGAVVSEALMAGTPVICSDACGAAGVVKESGFGGIFSRDSGKDLLKRLNAQHSAGPISTENRMRLAAWASALGADAGARYLIKIIECDLNGGLHPIPPWENRGATACAE